MVRELALRFAKTMLYWRGHLRAGDVEAFLGVSERTARSLIADWRAADILPRYRPTAARRLIPSEHFDPGPSVKDPVVAYSMLMLVDHLPGNPFACTPLQGGAYDLSISAKVMTGATRRILGACLDREAVQLIYSSKTGIQEFVFSPSALVRARGRFHFRGLRANVRDALGNKLDDRYVDVIPARAIDAWRTTKQPHVGLESDEDWNTFEQCHLSLSPELTKEERLCYEREYGMFDLSVLKVSQRRALMPYVLQELAERRCWRRDGTSVRIWEIPRHGSDNPRVRSA